MQSTAMILREPGTLSLGRLTLVDPGPTDVVVDVVWSGISAGTERLLWSGRMPSFPGMGYPLVPGYESVGRIIDAGIEATARIGDWVFVPGANCYQGARGLFGGSASRVVLASERALAVPETLGADGVLIALAATAHHALAGHPLPDLIVGHGVLGRLLARLTIAAGGPPPTVWESQAVRRAGAVGYTVTEAALDDRRDYRAIYDVSGAAAMIDPLLARLARGGELVLAGFYTDRIGFDFAPAFMREARLRIASEFLPADLAATRALIDAGTLSLAGLVTDIAAAGDAEAAYPRAFEDPACLKMVLDWRTL